MDIERSILADLKCELLKPEILILIGARQVGKTFLMDQLEGYLQSKKKKTKYYNLEIPRDSRFFSQDIVELYDQITEDVDYLFIDEFQYFDNASKFFKAIFDDKTLNIKIIASGSSSLEIHKHLDESLAGRKVQKIIFPLAFLEYSQVNPSFECFLLYGALPGIYKQGSVQSKIDLLNNLLETYILKDVKSLIKEENVSAFNKLLYLLADYQGQLVTVSSLAKELMLNNKTVESYLLILEQTFVLYPLLSYAQNLSNELKKSKKYFLFDLGIRNAILSDFSGLAKRQDKGVFHETYVNNYIRSQMPKNSELRFWRTKKAKENPKEEEIDFVYLKNRLPYIIEVKSKLKKAELPKAFEKFLKAYPKTQGCFVINENITEELNYRGFTVHFIKISELEEDSNFNDIFLV